MIHERTSKTSLEELQSLVGGSMKIIPGFNRYKGARCQAVCDEEGKLKGKPINEEATRAWFECVDNWGDDFLVGDIVIVYGGLK